VQVEAVRVLRGSVAAPSPSESQAASGATASFEKKDGGSTSWATLLPFALLAVLVVLLYRGIAVKLVSDWYDLPDFSHGFLIPFFAAYLIWIKREEIAHTPVGPSWAGTPVVLLGLLLLLTGRFGADLFLSRVSFILLAAGAIWMVWGRPMLRNFRFVLLVLVLAIPLPAVVFNQITFPLQLFASRVASSLLPLAGVPVLREGNVIQLPAMQLEVAEACSGIRSLLSLFTLAVIYGYFLEKRTSRRVVLAIASVPIAVAANVARIFGTGLCVQYWDPDKAMGFFHEFSGWLMFIVSLGFLYMVHRLTGLFWSKRREALA
jgi:exosortase